jgi:hypothetical protein
MPSPDDAHRLLRSAIDKRARGERLTREESRALDRAKKEQDDRLRDQHYAAVPKRCWAKWSGRQQKVLNEQAARYGIPIAGATISLPAVALWLHEFLATHARRLAGVDADDPLLAGASSPALERYRLARAKREELGYERDLGAWLPRTEVHEGLELFAAILRPAIETLQRQFGPAAHALVDDALTEAIHAFHRHFSDPETRRDDAPPDGPDAPPDPAGASPPEPGP